MARYRLLLEYDGSAFQGWQRQSNGPSVQQALEEALQALTGERVTIVAAGRTDAGVHAIAQVAHLDLARDFEPERLAGGLNHHIRAHAIAVLEARRTEQRFHARFSATGRRYLYRILDRRAPPVLDSTRVWHIPTSLEAERMQEAAGALIGRHDFTSFRASECQANSPLKTLDHLEVRRRGGEVQIIAAARSFLHHQVRNITGTLVRIGSGKEPVAYARKALEARDRSAAGPTAPAHGLYLVEVTYG